ncbi:MAG: DUF2085 domain-containing protein [Brevefilum sp.]|nr:DUF2085 domain-containing protein [Brevefilum sp.]
MDTANPLVLRRFIGNPDMGWKVAWTDRMIFFYSGVWVFAMSLYPFWRKIKKLPLWGLVLFLFPMIIDGGSHIISELAGSLEGFRFTNLWLASLTANRYSASFYAGNMLGSFNSWMRIVTGSLAGFGLSWFILSTVKPNLTEYNPNK